jgi:hypothetical protein
MEQAVERSQDSNRTGVPTPCLMMATPGSGGVKGCQLASGSRAVAYNP